MNHSTAQPNDDGDYKGPPKITFVDDSKLVPLDVRQRFDRYIASLWRYRAFIKADAVAKAFRTAKNTYLGYIWLLLEPALQVSIYFIVFGMLLKTDRGIENYLGFLVIGVIFFGFISRALNSGSLLIQRSRKLISSFRFPRAAVPLARSLGSFYDNIVPALFAIVAAVALQREPSFHWQYIAAIPLFFLLCLFCAGLTLIIARVTAFIPDVKTLVSFISRALFFTSGVFFSIDRFRGHPTITALVEKNPVYVFLSMFRQLALTGSLPSSEDWIYITLWSVAILFLGLIYFWQAEERYVTVK